jgi:hypothetical protein
LKVGTAAVYRMIRGCRRDLNDTIEELADCFEPKHRYERKAFAKRPRGTLVQRDPDLENGARDSSWAVIAICSKIRLQPSRSRAGLPSGAFPQQEAFGSDLT